MIHSDMKVITENARALTDLCSSGLSTPALKMAFRTFLKENGFGKTVDSNRNLIGFNDGVYDLERAEFRPFNIHDVVTMSTGYDFPTETEYEQEIDTFFEQVFPDVNIRHFMKKFLASCLAGCNDYEILSFWTGASEGKQTGANGKSALCTLMAKALGDYYTEGTPSIITGKREKAESANSAMASFKNKRFIPFQEIDR